MTLRAIAIVGAGLLLGAAGPVTEDLPSGGTPDLTQAEELYRTTCRNCHGPKAKGMASFPALAHQEEDFIAERLKQYRAGEKVGSNTALMAPHAAKLSDEDIAGLAAYITTSFD